MTADDSRPYGPAMPATTAFGDLLQHAVVYSRAEIGTREYSASAVAAKYGRTPAGVSVGHDVLP